MVQDIKSCIDSWASRSKPEVTFVIRGIDGLILDVNSFYDFLSWVSKKVKPLIIFQYSAVNDDIRHPRLRPYLGLGSVMAFTVPELKDSHDPDTIRLLEIFQDIAEAKISSGQGLSMNPLVVHSRTSSSRKEPTTHI